MTYFERYKKLLVELDARARYADPDAQAQGYDRASWIVGYLRAREDMYGALNVCEAGDRNQRAREER